ncbi:MAG: isoprenylcysteine carboxylmethyltransferase family protein [Verrucomicrobia bacterium]|nr:isoprenylcysteine carboxylmethyltransferase family protein [Verrucomicrobiota bacterium]
MAGKLVLDACCADLVLAVGGPKMYDFTSIDGTNKTAATSRSPPSTATPRIAAPTPPSSAPSTPSPLPFVRNMNTRQGNDAAPLAGPPPVLLFLVCLLGGFALQHFWPKSIGGYSLAVAMGVGAPLLLSGASLVAWGILEMRRSSTTFLPGQVPSRLVTSGPFRWSRNPLYVAQLLILAAIAIMADSLWLAFGVPALLLLLDRLVVVREEAVIRAAFGADYAAYTTRVRRWL